MTTSKMFTTLGICLMRRKRNNLFLFAKILKRETGRKETKFHCGFLAFATDLNQFLRKISTKNYSEEGAYQKI